MPDPLDFTGKVVLVTGSSRGIGAETIKAFGERGAKCVVNYVADPEGVWMAAYGVGEGGAVLVRPDGYVAWRAASAPADPARALSEAFGQILARPVLMQAV